MEARIGVVIRDLLASVKLTASKTIFNALNAEEMKALACKDDIGLAGEMVPGANHHGIKLRGGCPIFEGGEGIEACM